MKAIITAVSFGETDLAPVKTGENFKLADLQKACESLKEGKNVKIELLLLSNTRDKVGTVGFDLVSNDDYTPDMSPSKENPVVSLGKLVVSLNM